MRLPTFRGGGDINDKGLFSLSFPSGDPVRYRLRLRSMIPPLETGILVGEGVSGVRGELNLWSDFVLQSGDGDKGELPPNVAAAISILRSDKDDRLFFFNDLLVSAGGGKHQSVIVAVVLCESCQVVHQMHQGQ